jgi:FMN phosphatase YigB (HAD superfamily)
MRRFRVSKDETLFVGDMDRDKEAARRAGARFMWADEFFDWDGRTAYEI